MMTDKYNNITKKFGKKVKLERVKRDLSQEALADLSNLSRPYLGAIERAESVASIETAASIARGLGIDLDKLFIFDDLV